ncbi:MAG: ATP-dependent zinc metalloprotease FtsH, partial [Patescibacteria group bacterium]
MKLLSKNIAYALLIFAMLAFGYSLYLEQAQERDIIPLSQVVEDIKAGAIEKVVVEEEALLLDYRNGSVKKALKETDAAFSETMANYGITPEQYAGLNVEVKGPSGFAFWSRALFPFFIPIFLIAIFLWMMSRQVQRANVQALGFGQSRARLIAPDDLKDKITFKDVAGVDEAKEELKEIVDFLKNPKKFLDIGARIPRGVLLIGAPGAGKTLLAKAVAGEAVVPFFQISASEFVEMFVGVGAARTRDLFKMAKKAAPSIIFIDELDAVGRHRGAGFGGGNDEREQTLNQILVEMDGFDTSDQVIVIAATNRPDVLDPALLRPGRFDRRVILDLPDIAQREAILKIHSRKKPFTEDVNLRRIAERTPGFSGADLANLVNEGAIFAARKNRKKVTQFDLLQSIEKVLLGPERKSHLLSEKEKEISAYHEAGHALVAAVMPHTDPVHKVSIVSRGRAAGYTLKLPSEDRHLHTYSYFLDELAAAIGGYAAEKLVFGEITTGPSDDLRKATAIARDLVMRYGMSEKIGP